MFRRSAAAATTVSLLSLGLLAAGCGGDSGVKISDAKSCLQKIDGMKVEDAPKDDKNTEDGVIGTRFDTSGDKSIIAAVAAHAKSSDDVKDFKKSLEQTSGDSDSADVQSGTDGKYVWVVTGPKDDEDAKTALGCVKP